MALNWPRQARPAGAAPSVLDLSTASHQTGRSVLSTIICSWAMPTIRSPVLLFLPLLLTTGSPRTWIWSPRASTTALAVTVRRSQRGTDLALFLLLQQTGSAEMPAFLLLEVTCLKKPSGPRHNRAAGRPADCINRALAKSDIVEICHAIRFVTRERPKAEIKAVPVQTAAPFGSSPSAITVGFYWCKTMLS